MEEGSLFQRMRQVLKNEEDDGVRKEAAELIRNVFRYMDKDAKDIMTHRKNIIAISMEETIEEVLKFMLSENYSRFPIFLEDIDEIVGIIHLREAMVCYLDDNLRTKQLKELAEMTDYIRPVAFIPETKSIDTLFKEMQAEKNHMAVVLDEYGQTSGLVAMEDILEEIVGNILDEHDEEEELVKKMQDGGYIADGFVDLEELEELLPIVFEKEEYETLNGFLVAQLDRIPTEDETCIVDYEGYRFTVLTVDNKTIQRVKIEKIKEEC